MVEARPDWTFLSNHGHVLVCIGRDPNVRVRDIADSVGITVRAVQRILSELEDGGVIERVRNGRRTRYEIDTTKSLRHSIESTHSVGELLALIE